MTLKEHRIIQRRSAMQDLFQDIELLRRCDREGASPNEFSRVTAAIENRATRVQQLSWIIEDLDDVERYGPEGGRGSTSAKPGEP